MREKVPSQSLAWFAADLNKSAGLVDFLGLVGGRSEAVQALLAAKELTLSISADKEWTLQLQMRVESAKEMESIEKKLKSLDWREPRSLKVAIG